MPHDLPERINSTILLIHDGEDSNMKTRQRRLECDRLEARELLSAAQTHFGGHAQARHSMGGSGSGVSSAQVGSVSPVTGGGLVNVPPAPSSGDVQMLQGAASADELVIFLTQMEVLSGSNPAVQQTAASILNDARNVELALNAFAGGLGVTLPPNIAGYNQVLARQMISGVRTGSVDPTYSSLIVQAETSLVAQFQQMATSAQDPSVRSFAAGVLPTVQSDLGAALGIISLPPVSDSASSDSLDSSDLSTLETYYSIDQMEHFLGQLTTLFTPRTRVVQYAAKLIGDHESANIGLGVYAAATGTYLPASISSADVPMASTVVAALNVVPGGNTTPYDRVYLRQMIMGHTAALQFTYQTIATTQNPVLKQFATNVEPTVNMLLQVARLLQSDLNS
jgi:predicted outer membrane protein